MLVRGDGVNALLAGDAAHTRAELTAVAPELGVLVRARAYRCAASLTVRTRG